VSAVLLLLVLGVLWGRMCESVTYAPVRVTVCMHVCRNTRPCTQVALSAHNRQSVSSKGKGKGCACHTATAAQALPVPYLQTRPSLLRRRRAAAACSITSPHRPPSGTARSTSHICRTCVRTHRQTHVTDTALGMGWTAIGHTITGRLAHTQTDTDTDTHSHTRKHTHVHTRTHKHSHKHAPRLRLCAG